MRGISFAKLPEATQLDLVREAGFDLVRLAVEWGGADFRPVDEAIAAALERGFAVVVDVHHFRGTDRELLELWALIAPHYAGIDGRLRFELLNEPHDPLTAARWNALLREVLAVVRESNPERTVIVGPAHWNTVGALPALRLPEDEHLVLTVHYYSPFRFTHQGAWWLDGAREWLGTAWGAAAGRARVRTDLEAALAYGRPLLLGEFGTIAHAAMDDRAAWTRVVREEAERLGIDWCYWDFATDFGVYDLQAGAWRAPLLDALMAR